MTLTLAPQQPMVLWGNQDQPHIVQDRVVSLRDASHIAGVSIDTLRRCNQRKEISIVRLSPRRVGVRLSDLKAFIDARAI